MSGICRSIVWNSAPANKDRKMKIPESDIEELCPRIWALSVEHAYASEDEKAKCFLQTLLKGSFSLLGVKSPKVSLKVSAVNIQVFFQIFETIVKICRKSKKEENL